MRIHKGNHQGEYKGVEPGDLAQPEVPRHKPRARNKRKWCGGKHGREHDVRWVPDDRYGWFEGWGVVYFNRTCFRCKKVMKVERRSRVVFWNPTTNVVVEDVHGNAKGWVQLAFAGPGFPPREKLI